MPPGVKGMLSAALLMLAGCQAVPEQTAELPYLVIQERRVPVVSVFDLNSKTLHTRVDLPVRGGLSQSVLWVNDTLYATERRSDGFTDNVYTDLLWLNVEADTFDYAYSLPASHSSRLAAVSHDHQHAVNLLLREDRWQGQFAPYLIAPMVAPKFETTQAAYLTTGVHVHHHEVIKVTPDTLWYTEARLQPYSTYMTPGGGLFVAFSRYTKEKAKWTRSANASHHISEPYGYTDREQFVIVGYDLARGTTTLEDSVDFEMPRFISSPDERYLYYVSQTAVARQVRQFDRERAALRTLRELPREMGLGKLLDAYEDGVLGYSRYTEGSHFIRIDTTGAIVQHDSISVSFDEIRRLDARHYLAIEPPPLEDDRDAWIDHFMVHYIQDDPIRLIRTDTIRFNPMPRLWWSTHGTTPAPTD